MVFPKKCPCTASFFVISGKMVFLLFRNNDIFYLGRKRKEMIFLKKSVGNMVFSVYMRRRYCHDVALLEKKTKMTLPRKKTISDISGIIKKDEIHPKAYGISAEISH